MIDNPHTLVTRFQTPDPRIPPREQAPMQDQERAWAQEYALGQRFSWIAVLVPPLCFGPVLPGLAWLLGLLLYRAMVDARLDIDAVLGNSFIGVLLATALFMACWVQLNVWQARRDPSKRYWQTMPAQGLVELERHTLVAGTNLWSNAYDPDCNTVLHWRHGTLENLQASGVTQWVVAMTAAGHWLVLKHEFAGPFSYTREGQMPAADQHLQPGTDLAIAFAPGTNLTLGQRFSGAPLPLENTRYWLAAEELKHLIEVAHHWTFSPPHRYAVVNEQDAQWVRRLVEKARGV